MPKGAAKPDATAGQTTSEIDLVDLDASSARPMGAKPPPTPTKTGLPPPRARSSTGGVKPLSPTSLISTRNAAPALADEDPPSSPISSVLGALGKSNSSGGMSTADALAAVRTAPSGPVAAPTAQPRISGASPAIAVPPVDEEPPPLPPISAEPSMVVAHDPRATIPGPAPAPRPAAAIDTSPMTEPMRAASPYPSAAPYLEAAGATSKSAATATIPGVGVGDPKRSQAGDDDDDDDDLVPARAAWLALLTPRNLAIGGGALVLFIIVIVFATRGGDDDKKSASKRVATAKVESKSDKNATANTGSGGTNDEATQDPGLAVVKPTTGNDDGTTGETGANTGRDDTGAGSNATGEPTSEPPADTGSATTTPVPPTTPPKAKVVKRPVSPTIGGKQVVLEYDSQARDTSAPAPANVAKSDQSAIPKARTAYASGNQRLFAGDPNGAIKFYRQALAYYPAYVAGYRGLGLAYAQQGNKAQAVQAFKTYVSSVPNAKDAGLIRKRIATLQAR